MAKSRDTVGKLSQELLKKPLETHDVIEQQRAMQQEYIDNLIFAVEHARKKIDCKEFHEGNPCDIIEARTGSFYVIVITKKERLMENVLRNYFFTRDACPTPDYDQAVYRFDHKTESIEFLWVIPDKNTCLMFIKNATQVPFDETGLLQFILDFKDGKLMNKSLTLNDELEK